MRLLRSLLFLIYLIVSACFCAVLMILLGFLPYKKRFVAARWWGVGMLWAGRWICGLQYVIEGVENIPNDASVILIKHTTVFEVYAPAVIFPPQTWVLKRELMWVPIFGWGLFVANPIAINRNAGHRAVTQVIEQGKKHLANGIWVTIFPEGTRVRSGTTRKYGSSGAALAKAAGVKIVPIAHNAGDLWPRRGITKRPGLIRFVIGPSIDPSLQSPKETNLIVQAWIENKMAEISPEAYGRKSDQD